MQLLFHSVPLLLVAGCCLQPLQRSQQRYDLIADDVFLVQILLGLLGLELRLGLWVWLLLRLLLLLE